jgi:hypothetical protein
MKTIRLLLVIAFLVPFYVSHSQTTNGEKKSQEKIEAYYFHFTARCVTCRTVEEGAKENLGILYPNQVKEGKITFLAANMDEDAGKALAKKLGISAQTLLLVKGAKKVDLTTEAFLYAVTDPEKYRMIIKGKVDELLK